MGDREFSGLRRRLREGWVERGLGVEVEVEGKGIEERDWDEGCLSSARQTKANPSPSHSLLFCESHPLPIVGC